MESDWYISYRFYDPGHLDGNGKIKPLQRIIKGMNDCKNWIERRKVTEGLIDDELTLLLQGYSPIHKKFMAPELRAEIDENTYFPDALEFIKDKVKAGPSIISNNKSIVGYVKPAIQALRFHNLPIGDIKRNHIKRLLEYLSKTKERWTSNTFNYYRSHLIIMFNELMEYDAIEFNPVKQLRKEKHVKKIRETLSDEERLLVKNHLDKVYPAFSRLMEIFYHSGIREIEILSVKVKDVDLKKERFKVTVRKRGQPVEEWREIKVVALPLWWDAIKDADPDDYVFSRGFKPGPIMPSEEYIHKTWNKWVKNPKKKGIGITADFYAFKHAHTTDIIDQLEGFTSNAAHEAAEHNGHRSLDMVNQVYDVKSKARKGQLVKLLPNTFIPKQTGDI